MMDDSLCNTLVDAVRKRLQEKGGKSSLSSIAGAVLGKNPVLAEQVRKRWGSFSAFVKSRPEFEVSVDDEGRMILSLAKKKDFSCKECGASFLSKNSLWQHRTMKHEKKPSKNFPCQSCGSRFASEGALNQHASIKHPKPVKDVEVVEVVVQPAQPKEPQVSVLQW